MMAEPTDIAAAQLAADATLDALRECFIASSLAMSVVIQAGADDVYVEMLHKLGVKDGFGARAMAILTAAGIEPPDVAPLVKAGVDKGRRGH